MTQIEYLQILFEDCVFNGAQQRDFLGARFAGRRFLDQLTPSECHTLIEDLKERKVRPLPVEEEDAEVDMTAKERFKRRAKES